MNEKAMWLCESCGKELKGFSMIDSQWNLHANDSKEIWCGYCPDCDEMTAVDLWRSDYDDEPVAPSIEEQSE